MTVVTSCSVNLLSKTYEIKCPEAEIASLKEASVKLNGLLRENKQKFPHLTEFQLMLLGALTYSHELLACEKQQEIEREHVTQFVELLERCKA